MFICSVNIIRIRVKRGMKDPWWSDVPGHRTARQAEAAVAVGPLHRLNPKGKVAYLKDTNQLHTFHTKDVPMIL